MLIVYTSTICHPCRVAKQRLTKAGIEFQEINLGEDAEALERLKKSLGVSQVTTPLFRWRGQLRQIDVLKEIEEAHKEVA